LLKPDYADAFINRGNARSAKGDEKGAHEDYEKAQRLRARMVKKLGGAEKA
jgi:hypothetical protein